MSKHKISDEEFIRFVKQSTSIRNLIQNMRLIAAGGNYRTCYKRIEQLDLDTSHFTGQAWNKGKYHGPKKPIEDYLSNKHYMASYKLKSRLISEGIFEHKCSSCNLTEWLGEPIPIELDHIDGNHQNNNLSNLRILCPNCHARTPTYRGKKLKIVKNDDSDPELCRPQSSKYRTTKVKVKKTTNPNWRQALKPEKRKVERPPYDQLLREIAELGYCAVGRKYGVSDNAIRKWVKMYEKY